MFTLLRRTTVNPAASTTAVASVASTAAVTSPRGSIKTTGTTHGMPRRARSIAVAAAFLTAGSLVGAPAADAGICIPCGGGGGGGSVILPKPPAIGTAIPGAPGGAIDACASWAPGDPNGGSPLKGYRVTALKMSSTGDVLSRTTSALLPPSARTFVMALPAYGKYRFTVVVYNEANQWSSSGRSNDVEGR
jgi:hypothetical protein